MESKFIDAEQVCKTAMDELAMSDANDMNRFLDRTYIAVKEIGYPRKIVAKTDATWFPIENLMVEKPCDFAKLIDLMISDDDCCNLIYPIFRGTAAFCMGNTNSFNYVSWLGTAYRNINAGVTFDETNTHFRFSSDVCNCNGVAYTRAYIAYIHLPVDDKGFPLITQESEGAVLAYLIYMETAYRHRLMPRMVSLADVQDARQHWIHQKYIAKSKNNMPDDAEMREIIAKMHSLLPQPARSRDFDYKTNHARRGNWI